MSQDLWKTLSALLRKLALWADEKIPNEPPPDYQTSTVVWTDEGYTYMWPNNDNDVFEYTITVEMNDPDSTWSCTPPPKWYR